MASYIGWRDGNLNALPVKRGNPANIAGGNVREFVSVVTKKTTDGDGTVYFLAEIPADAVLVDLQLNCDALTGASSWDFGFYELDGALKPTPTADNAGSGTGSIPTAAKVDAGAILVSAQDYNAGKAIGSEQKLFGNMGAQTVTTLGAAAGGLLNFGLKLWQLLGYTDPKWKNDSYVLGLRLNTAGSAAGNIVVRGRYIEG